MNAASKGTAMARPTHPWLRRIRVAYVPGPAVPLLDDVAHSLLAAFRRRGHEVQTTPTDETDVVLTTARFGQPIHWRQAPFFNLRRRFGLSRQPVLYTMVHATPAEFQRLVAHLRAVLPQDPPNPADYDFPGLAPQAYQVLFEQGHRGGAILAAERVVQVQAMNFRVLLVLGEDRPQAVYHFDLIGAHPRTDAADPDFYDDIALRIVTTQSTHEATNHQVLEDLIPHPVWQQLRTPAAMVTAARQFGARHFFTQMVHIADLVNVPFVPETVAEQYSEGCFATWDPTLHALIVTATGSSRPIYKGDVTENDLVVIAGVRPDSSGALIRRVEGRGHDVPSTESVEMMGMDSLLPTVTLNLDGAAVTAPVVRSKLHGHRGIAAYDPRRVEYVPLDPPYYHYLVTCGTDAQARGVEEAFARSEALQNPVDPRPVVFTVLPGHGAFIVEKWVPGAEPFQTIWEYMDAGYLQVASDVPQGPMIYAPGPDGRIWLQTSEQ